MVDVASISKFVLDANKFIGDFLSREIDSFKLKNNITDFSSKDAKEKILFDVVEPILLSSLGVVLGLFARMLYSEKDVLDICTMLYKQQYAYQMLVDPPPVKPVTTNEIKLPLEKTENDSTALVINTKPNKDLN